MMVLNGDHHPGDVVDQAHPEHIQGHPEHTVLNGNHFHSPHPMDPVMYFSIDIASFIDTMYSVLLSCVACVWSFFCYHQLHSNKILAKHTLAVLLSTQI